MPNADQQQQALCIQLHICWATVGLEKVVVLVTSADVGFFEEAVDQSFRLEAIRLRMPA